MSTVLETLKAARSYIALSSCVQTRGKTADGKNCDGYKAAAVSWCALGAIDKALGCLADHDPHGRQVIAALALEVPERFRSNSGDNWSVAVYHNSITQAESVAFFDRAIARLEAELPPVPVKYPNWQAMAAHWTVSDAARDEMARS